MMCSAAAKLLVDYFTFPVPCVRGVLCKEAQIPLACATKHPGKMTLMAEG